MAVLAARVHGYGDSPLVLVVDGNPGIRDDMALSLKRSGFLAEQARGGEEALRMVRPGAHEAVVADLRMPGMDGLQLTA